MLDQNTNLYTCTIIIVHTVSFNTDICLMHVVTVFAPAKLTWASKRECIIHTIEQFYMNYIL